MRPDLCHGGTWGPIKKRPTEYLRQMYYDTMVFSEEGLRHLVAEVEEPRLGIEPEQLRRGTAEHRYLVGVANPGD